MFDNYAVTVMIGGEPYTLGLFDTAGKATALTNNTTDFLDWLNRGRLHIAQYHSKQLHQPCFTAAASHLPTSIRWELGKSH